MTQTEDRVEEYLARGLKHLWVHTQQYNDLAREDGPQPYIEKPGG